LAGPSVILGDHAVSRPVRTGGKALIEIIAPPLLPGRNRVMPYLLLHDFLEESMAANLLEYAIAHEAEFLPTRVGDSLDRRVDQQHRVSVGTWQLRQFEPILKAKLLGLLPEFAAALRSTSVEVSGVDLQLVAHNDGEFLKRHIDTMTASVSDRIRILSGVYYVHAKPKAFTGGALRLGAIGDRTGSDFVEIEPAHNSLVIFHSWVPHEVMPVACPSRNFRASRFSINCWFYRGQPEVHDVSATEPAKSL
jgi:SM-20-related protein